MYSSFINVLIVPLWNWNNAVLQDQQAELGFNRTFMELKYQG